MANLLIVGDGGHGKTVYDAALETKKYDKISFLVNYSPNEKLDGVEYYLESEYLMSELINNYKNLIVAIGDNRIRLEKSLYYKENGFNLATIIHPTAFVSKFSTIKEGSYIGPNSVVNSFSKVGFACIINTGSIVEHECILGNGVHLSPNVSMGGKTIIGNLTWICVGSCIADKIIIGKEVIVAAGSSVIRNVNDNVMVAGVPATEKKNLYFE